MCNIYFKKLFCITTKWFSYTYMYTIYIFFFKFFSYLGYYRILSRVPCAICMLSHFSWVWFFVTPCTVAHQGPLSMGFSSKNTGVGCHFLLQGIFPTQGLNPASYVSYVGSKSLTTCATWEAPVLFSRSL